jgi:transketolase
MAVEHVLLGASETCVLRLNIGPSPREIRLPADYRLERGRGVVVAGGGRASLKIIAYGPVMLHEALVARELLVARGQDTDVVNLPWLNSVDEDWLKNLVARSPEIVVVEDHAPIGGLGDFLLRRLNHLGLLAGCRLRVFGVEGLCACGTPDQALRHHALDGASLAQRAASGVFEAAR